MNRLFYNNSSKNEIEISQDTYIWLSILSKKIGLTVNEVVDRIYSMFIATATAEEFDMFIDKCLARAKKETNNE